MTTLELIQPTTAYLTRVIPIPCSKCGTPRAYEKAWLQANPGFFFECKNSDCKDVDGNQTREYIDIMARPNLRREIGFPDED